MSVKRDPAEEQPHANDPYDAVDTGEAAPAIDAEGIGEENPDRAGLDSTWVSTDE